MAVRAKMRVSRLTEFTDGGYTPKKSGVAVTLQAVYGGANDEANKEWSKHTPSGQLELTITNPEAFKQFELGKAYYVDLTPAED